METVKRCTKCEEEKDLDSLVSDKRLKSGKGSMCKRCAVNIQKKRYLDPLFAKAKCGYSKQYAKKNRDRRVELDRAWRLKHPCKKKAQDRINSLIRSGKLVPPAACERCSNADQLQAHHEDYSKPLEVQWLCITCHNTRHKEIRNGLANSVVTSI